MVLFQLDLAESHTRNHIGRLNAKCNAHSAQRVQAHRPLPPFDQRHRHRMQLSLVGQLFLRHAPPLPPLAQLLAELLDVAVARHACKASGDVDPHDVTL